MWNSWSAVASLDAVWLPRLLLRERLREEAALQEGAGGVEKGFSDAGPGCTFPLEGWTTWDEEEVSCWGTLATVVDSIFVVDDSY